MAVGTTNFSELLDPGIRSIYGLSYDNWVEEYSQYMEVLPSNQYSEYSLSIAGFGLVPVKSQGGGVNYATPGQGYKGTLTHISYGLGFQVTYELYRFDQYGIINRLPQLLARSVRRTRETLGANILNRAFDSSYTGADGKELCATNHQKWAGGTWQNESTTAADLSMTSYEQALIDISDFSDDNGTPVGARPVKLIVATENLFTAQQIINSSQDPESAMNAINPAKGTTTIMESHFMTNTDDYFIKTDVPNGLVWYDADKPDFDKDNDFDSKNGKWKSFFICIQGWNDPRGMWGSPGA